MGRYLKSWFLLVGIFFVLHSTNVEAGGSCVQSTNCPNGVEYFGSNIDQMELEGSKKTGNSVCIPANDPRCLEDENANNQNSENDDCAEYKQLASSCAVEFDSAMSRCDDKTNPEISQAQQSIQMAVNGLSSAANSSIQLACSKMNDVSMVAQGALGAFKMVCESSRRSCITQCQQAVMALKANPHCPLEVPIKTNLQKCNAIGEQMSQVTYSMQSLMSQQAAAKRCAALTGNAANLNEYCQANPMSPLCTKGAATDCNDPAVASTNPVCICNINPRNPICAGGGTYNSSNKPRASSSSGNKLSNAGIPNGMNAYMDGDPTNMNNARKGYSKVDGASSGGSLGGGPSGGNSGGGGGDSGNGGSGSRSRDRSIPGFYGGGGGGATGGRGGSGNSSDTTSTKYIGSGNLSPNSIDLKQFLPGQKPTQSIYGSTGPDGITGPHTSIWQKVRVRYLAITPTMRP